jgi:hypothetical protein
MLRHILGGSGDDDNDGREYVLVRSNSSDKESSVIVTPRARTISYNSDQHNNQHLSFILIVVVGVRLQCHVLIHKRHNTSQYHDVRSCPRTYLLFPSPRHESNILVITMGPNIFAIVAIVAVSVIGVTVIVGIVEHYVNRAIEIPEEKQLRLELENAGMGLKRLKKEQKRKRARENEEEMPDSVVFSWTAAH